MAELQEIASTLNYLKVDARTKIMDIGDPGDQLYIMLDGLVDVVVPVEKNNEPKQVSIDFNTGNAVSAAITRKSNALSRPLVDKKRRSSMWKQMKSLGHSYVEEFNKMEEIKAQVQEVVEEEEEECELTDETKVNGVKWSKLKMDVMYTE